MLWGFDAFEKYYQRSKRLAEVQASVQECKIEVTRLHDAKSAANASEEGIASLEGKLTDAQTQNKCDSQCCGYRSMLTREWFLQQFGILLFCSCCWKESEKNHQRFKCTITGLVTCASDYLTLADMAREEIHFSMHCSYDPRLQTFLAHVTGSARQCSALYRCDTDTQLGEYVSKVQKFVRPVLAILDCSMESLRRDDGQVDHQ